MINSWPQKLLVTFFLATTVSIVLYTMYAAFHYSSNAILGRDEANFIILSSQKILAASNAGEFIKGFFPSHGQHTLVGMQIVNMFTYFSFGVLDRRIMNVIGVMLLSLAALLLPGSRGRSKTETILLYAALFPLILSPAHNACIVNASCTGNHYFGVAASVVSLYLFTRVAERKIFFVGAEIFMLLAVFSLPAALALVPVSILILATMVEKNKAGYLVAHFALIIVSLIVHSYLTYPSTIFTFAQDTDSILFSDALTALVLFAATFFIIMGSLFYWLNDMGYGLAVAALGMAISILLVIVLSKSYKSFRKDGYAFPFYGALLFVFMIMIIAFGRYYSFGSSRYAVYTAHLCAMLLLVLFYQLNQSQDLFHTTRRIKILLCSSALSLVYFLTALHYHQQYLLDLEQKDVTCREMWYREGYACGVMIKHEEATRIIKEAIDQGIYRIE